MKLTLGFSPCPNDTFIFDAIVNGRIDTGVYEFEVILADVSELNRIAVEGQLDITKISIGAYPLCSDKYILLDAGSALGMGVGPLLVSRVPLDFSIPEKLTVAIPGYKTTANFLLDLFYPELTNKKIMVFSEIENAVLKGNVDLGLLIHEGRFTYMDHGLWKVADLGELWEHKTGKPLALGGIAASRNIPEHERIAISNLIRHSIEYAFASPQESAVYIKTHSQEMDESVINQHIGLYVNDFSIDLGQEGREAIRFILEKGAASGFMPLVTEPLFNTEIEIV